MQGFPGCENACMDTTLELKRLAAAALSQHDELTAATQAEPELDEDGLPKDTAAWLTWNTERYLPAYAAWSEAISALEAAGYSGGRHPFNFRPYCKQVLAA